MLPEAPASPEVSPEGWSVCEPCCGATAVTLVCVVSPPTYDSLILTFCTCFTPSCCVGGFPVLRMVSGSGEGQRGQP